MERAEGVDGDRDGGQSVEAIAEEVVAADGIDADETEAVAATLRGIASEGVVTGASVTAAMAQLSKVVSTPATRIEFSGLELESARTDASGVADVPSVAARLDGYTADVERVKSAVETLDDDLRALVDRTEAVDVAVPPTADEAVILYEIAAEYGRIHTEATRLQNEADQLTEEIESFGRWLTRPSVRHDELRADTEELAAAVAALEDDVSNLAGTGADDAEQWSDCAIRRRVLALQSADIRAAATDIATVDDRRDADPDDPVDREVRERTDELDERLAAAADRLDTLSRPEWRDRFDQNVAVFDEELSTFEPPVEWSAVLTALKEIRDTVK
ncbi:hypothetical protein GRX01_03370 [Halobaculum sp. WSA2]|uniref:Halo transducer protein n=1 Tax=Halobaculum saliterrae TaxID=2073113 RepID=A0A6B0SPQ1_9EURY|nr:hypothetical protein [Halobaculum saliterrae]MXR40397.1 hypothetical protein [Halobaculum saliterrae]